MALNARQRREHPRCQWPLVSSPKVLCGRVAPLEAHDVGAKHIPVCRMHGNVARRRGVTVKPPLEVHS
jgi:hypothetical protein